MGFNIVKCLVRLFAARAMPYNTVLVKLVFEPRAFCFERIDVAGVECANVRPEVIQNVLSTLVRGAKLVESGHTAIGARRDQTALPGSKGRDMF